MKHPDAKNHLYVSLFKSAIRIVGYVGIYLAGIPALKVAAVVLVISEIIGIIEELV